MLDKNQCLSILKLFKDVYQCWSTLKLLKMFGNRFSNNKKYIFMGKDLLHTKLQQLLQNTHMSMSYLVKNSILTQKFSFKYKSG